MHSVWQQDWRQAQDDQGADPADPAKGPKVVLEALKAYKDLVFKEGLVVRVLTSENFQNFKYPP